MAISQSSNLMSRTAKLFRAIGHAIIDTPKVYSSEIPSFVAELRLGPTSIRTLISCIEQEEIVTSTQLALAIYPIVHSLADRMVDKAIIVTSAAFSTDARELGDQARIQLYSFEELQVSIVDFSEYYNWPLKLDHMLRWKNRV